MCLLIRYDIIFLRKYLDHGDVRYIIEKYITKLIMRVLNNLGRSSQKLLIIILLDPDKNTYMYTIMPARIDEKTSFHGILNLHFIIAILYVYIRYGMDVNNHATGYGNAINTGSFTSIKIIYSTKSDPTTMDINPLIRRNNGILNRGVFIRAVPRSYKSLSSLDIAIT